MTAPWHFQSLPLALSQKSAWLTPQLTSLSAGQGLQALFSRASSGVLEGVARVHGPKGRSWAPSLLLTTSLSPWTPDQGREGLLVPRVVTHLSYHYLLLGMCYEQWSDLLSVHSHHFLKRLHCFVETGGHDRMGGTGVL